MITKLLIVLFLTLCANKVSSFTCGKSHYTSGLIIGGDKVNRGEFPFVAALFYIQHQKFFCAGTLITAEHVVSAAHCFQQKSENIILQPHELVVYLGKHDLTSTFERGSMPVYAKRIIIHPGWSTLNERYDNDIAVIVLENPVQGTEYIMPACWPFDSSTFNDGFIVSV